MMDLRYHIVSLIAVFLALAAGVLVGAALFRAENKMVAVSQLQLDMQSLRQQDTQIRAENARVQQQLAAWDRTARELRGPLLRDRLAGQRVGLVLCGDRVPPAFVAELEQTLRESGAQVGPRISLPDDPQALEAGAQARFSAVWEPGGVAPPTRYQPVAWLFKGLAAGGYGQRLEELARLTGIRVEGSMADPVRRFVVVAGPAEEARATRLASGDLPEFAVLAATTADGLRAVFTAAETGGPSSLPQVAGRGATAVDNADRGIGQFRVVLLLGGSEGTGLQRTAAGSPVLVQ